MASLKRLSILGAATLLTVAAVSVVMAQTGTGGASPMYDVKTETTIKGTVESVDTVTGAGGRGRQCSWRDASHSEDREGGARGPRRTHCLPY